MITRVSNRCRRRSPIPIKDIGPYYPAGKGIGFHISIADSSSQLTDGTYKIYQTTTPSIRRLSHRRRHSNVDHGWHSRYVASPLSPFQNPSQLTHSSSFANPKHDPHNPKHGKREVYFSGTEPPLQLGVRCNGDNAALLRPYLMLLLRFPTT
jgi:hypothetical protein